MSFERRHQPLASPGEFRRRMLRSFALGGSLLGVSLAVGVAGYHWWAGMPWLDALLNASMILGGMGPVDAIARPAGKWFASAYALYSGVMLLTSVGVILSPAVHRLLHAFHIEEEADQSPGPRSRRP